MSNPPVAITEETIFTYGAPPLKMGRGASDEIGFDPVSYTHLTLPTTPYV